MTSPVYSSGAKWIWSSGDKEQCDVYRVFRFTFEREPEEKNIHCRLAADSRFALFFNEVRIPGGQFSDYPDLRTVSDFNLTPFLRPGRNVVAVLVHYWGESFHTYIPGAPGLLAEIRSDRRVVGVSDGNWKCAPAPGLVSGSGRKMTFQAGYIFEYDARVQQEWSRIDFDDSEWQPATERPEPPPEVVPRPVSQLKELEPVPVSICQAGELLRGNVISDSPAELCRKDFLRPRLRNGNFNLEELREKFGFLNCDKLVRRFGDGYFLALTPPSPDANGLYCIVDLGAETVGFLRFVLRAPAGTRVDIVHGEHLDDGRVRAKFNRYQFGDCYHCREGVNDFLFPLRRLGCRYIELHFTNFDEGGVALQYAGLVPTVLPLPPSAPFECSDRETAHLRELGKRTLALCMHEHYEDCPWREQALWNFDARVQMFLGYHLWGNYDFAAASLGIAARSCRDGYLALTSPGVFSGRTIPSFSFAWINALYENYLFGADAETVRKHLPTVREILERALERRDGEFFTPGPGALWNFYEWCGQLNSLDEFPQLPYNISFREALLAGSRLLAVGGDSACAGEWEKEALRLGRTVEERFREGALYGALLPGRNSLAYEFVQLLMLHQDLVPPDRIAGVQQALFSGKLMPATSASMFFVLEALMKLSPEARREVERILEREFSPMLRAGATSLWETGKGADDMGEAGSLCHGWSAIHAAWCGRYLLGVSPIEPGFRKFRVKIFAGRHDHASGEVPTPHGPIFVEWRKERGGLRVKVVHPVVCSAVPDSFEECAVNQWEVSER